MTKIIELAAVREARRQANEASLERLREEEAKARQQAQDNFIRLLAIEFRS